MRTVKHRAMLSVIFAILSTGSAADLDGAEPPGLIGHWKLAGDTKDSSIQGNHGIDRGVDLKATGRDGKDGSAAGFDGRGSRIEVASSKSLQFGSDEFSIAMWVNTSEELDDTLGDLLSKYDPVSRRGLNFGIQNHAGVTSSQANYRHLHFGIDNGSPIGAWTDHGQLGNAVLIYGMAVFDGQLFAGTCEAGQNQAGRVFRYDGQTWTDCGSPDKCNAVSALAVYAGRLYVGVSKYRLAGSSLTESDNLNLGGTVYRYDGDDDWVPCGTLPDTEAINGMVVYRGSLYAGSMYAPAGFFRYDGGTQWTSCGTPGGKRVESLTVHNGTIFATGYDEGAVYRYDGRQWEHLGNLEGANQTYGFAMHNGQLYVSEWPHARVFRWGGGNQWHPAGRLGEEKETMPLLVYNGKMYAGTLPSAEVYRFDDPKWSKVGRLDFTPDVRYRRVWTMAVYRGRLFAGVLPSGHVHSIEVGRNVTYDRALPAGWVHLTAVRDSDHLRLHVNGKLVATSSKFKAQDYDISTDKPLNIGFGAHDYFNGRLSDVRLFGRALTEREIEQLADGNNSRQATGTNRAPFRAAEGLFDSSDTKTVGLQPIQGKHTTLYRATDDGYKFCHHPNLAVFKNHLYCMWSNGLVHEDHPGQRILYSRTSDGAMWTDPAVLAEDKDGTGVCVSSGFYVAGESLIAYYTTTGGSNFHADTALMARMSSDGRTWDGPRRIASGFFIEGPHQLNRDRLLLAGEHVGNARRTKRMQLLYSDAKDGLTGWQEASIEPTELETFGYTEPSYFKQRDGPIVATLRNYSGALYATASHDQGRSWSPPVRTNFLDSTARTSAGNLPDGTAYLVNNPMPKQFDRSVLTIALSKDGVTFDRAFLLRNEPTHRRHDGKSKLDGWQYPHALAWKGSLFVAYSINKEDIAITRIVPIP